MITEPLTGQRLALLQSRLRVAVVDLSYFLGLSMNRWGTFIHGHADTPLPNPSVALLARHFQAHPEQVPDPGNVQPKALFERIREIDPAYTLRRFALLMGAEAASGHRWVERGGGTSLPVERLMSRLWEALSGPAAEAALREFERRAESEARSRGIANIWQHGHWQAGASGIQGKTEAPVTGATLRQLQMVLGGIDADSMRYLLGVAMNVWGRLVNDATHAPLPRPTVGLLARFYRDHPEVVDLPTGVTPQEVFSFVSTVDPKYTLKRFGLLMGCDASAGYRWLKRGGNTSATVDRLLYFLARNLERDGDAALHEFEGYVEAEAKSRGIFDIWRSKGWKGM